MRKNQYITGVGDGKSLIVRSEKDANSDQIGTLKNGTVVTTLVEDGDRALITTGFAGWINKKYLADVQEPVIPDIGPEPEDENKKLQWYLHKWGFGAIVGAIDGKIGPKTTEAVKQFQSAMGLTVDGIVGPKTWAALKGEVIIPRIKEEEMTCQCDGKYCDGWPNPSTIGVRILIERIWRELEKRYPGVVLYVTNNAHPTPNGATAGGQRCKKWNADRGGASGSQHLYGRAADIYGKLSGTPDATIRQAIEDIALSLNVSGGVGYGARYIVHVDVRGKRSRWKY